jgi:hypothetical protein
MAVLAQRAAAGDAREIWTEAERMDADWGQFSTVRVHTFYVQFIFYFNICAVKLPAAKLFSAARTR